MATFAFVLRLLQLPKRHLSKQPTMSLSMANLEGLELVEIMDAVRTQEYIHISFYSLYVYYVLATLPEEITIIFPHKRNLGKGLFFVIRYGMCTYIALHFTRGYRNYYHISAQSCKALGIVQHFVYWLVDFSCSRAFDFD
ncbi:hypothetical protein FA13DRAFT_1810450 [Coprinellus micaceus]|uniref:DUF6533 domain-containing protein n=1 Tax=Coprinellus micaceus TaxID=71717 RepID=A0A4Y7TRU2_COPMI|nr:hypothetical protein FA13DRAFT_1810450 [Coprinellus micaceus]